MKKTKKYSKIIEKAMPPIRNPSQILNSFYILLINFLIL